MRSIQIIICFIFGGLLLCNAQGNDTLLVLEPYYINHFYQDNTSYASKCFDDALLDQKGRLWLRPCDIHVAINAIGLLQFDGYQFIPHDLTNADTLLTDIIRLTGISSSGHLFGTVGHTSHLFFTNLESRETQLISFDDFSNRIAKYVIETEPGHFLIPFVTKDLSAVGVLSLQNGILKEEWISDRLSDRKQPSPFEMPLVNTPQEIWFMDLTLPVYRYDKTTNKLIEYDTTQFNKVSTIDTPNSDLGTIKPTLTKSTINDLYIHLPRYYGDQFYQYDRTNDRFNSIMDQFPHDWKAKGVFQDLAGNICFLFQNANKVYQAILQDTLGNRFDYSLVVQKQSEIIKLVSQNFFQHVFAIGKNGLFNISIRQQQSIKPAMPGKWVSSIMQLPNDRVLINTVLENWYTLDPKTQISTPFNGPSCNIGPSPFSPGMKQQIHKDEQGNLWFISRQHLVRYHPIDSSCTSFDIGSECSLFCFVDKNLVVLCKRATNELLFYDISSQTFRDFGAGIPTKTPAMIRDFLIDAQGILWIASNRGLWKLNLKKEKSEVLFMDGSLNDVRFPSIYEAPDGKIWLGTYFNGLIIFDPDTGETRVVNQKQGLSNNSVMSIIADNDNCVWVGTEYGITLLSPEGQVLAEIHEADGLNCETFERFDAYKDKKGSLYFGCRNGVNIIDPKQFKANLIRSKKVNIYLTELAYFNEDQDKNAVRFHNLTSSERLSLPANHRYLRLKFALSSYIEPQRNRYAYKLEGIDQDWTYLGTQHELVLNQLPAGRYRLLIKGANYQNVWTEAPLVIPILAREFFYKQTWFYVLIFLVLALVALFWIRRLRFEKIRLEAEVQSRTEQIRQDKELIEDQAKELQQLDKVKSRFFTNISHELRTPITLINTPVEQVLRKYAKTFNAEVNKSLQTVHNNARKLLTLVEELLELSRIDAGKQQLNQNPTHLYSFCRQLFSTYESAASIKNVKPDFQYALDEDLHFLIDKKRLEKIINNLLSNALKFTEKGGKIIFSINTLGVFKTPRVLILKVEDTGRGIPPEDLPHIFDRYFQTKRESLPKEGGTGIGLALAKELAELMDGKLSVSSQWGRGSTFTLSIPVQIVVTDPYDPASTDLKPGIVSLPVDITSANSASNTAKKNRVLIVEDNPDMQQLIYSLLTDQYDCIIANNGARAWELLQQESTEINGIDLILSDVMMPEMDGYELVNHIKNHNKWRMTPIILLTARAAREDKLHGLRLGIDDYLIKPFSSEELLVRMENLIRHYQQRKLFLESDTYEVDIDFAPTPSAEDSWLKTLEHCILDAIEKRIELNVLYLASEMALSDRQLLRKLKALTGLSVAQYIKEVKLQKARHLLESKAFETISEVAYASGFNTPKYFSKVFEKRFGKLPGDYVQLHS